MAGVTLLQIKPARKTARKLSLSTQAKGPCGSLGFRLSAAAILLALELISISTYGTGSAHAAAPGLFWDLALSKYLAGFLSCYIAFFYLGRRDLVEEINRGLVRVPIALGLLLLQFPTFLIVAWLSAILHGKLTASPGVNLAVIAVIRLCVAFIALALTGYAFFPSPAQWKIAGRTSSLAAFSALAMALAWGLTRWNDAAWSATTEITFRLVSILVGLVSPGVVSNPSIRVIGTPQFSVEIASTCAGMEGAGLMLAFSLVYLAVFRKEVRFPQALALVPAGIVVLFLANSFRIAALVVLGTNGGSRLALAGFHSEAGWLCFIAVALAFCATARHLPALRAEHTEEQKASATSNWTASFLLPFVGMVICGVVAVATTGEAQWMYFAAPPLVGALLFLRRKDLAANYKFGWRGLLTGGLVFAVWMEFERLKAVKSSVPPAALHHMPAAGLTWMVFRVISSVVATPIAEELAFRGFVARRLVRREFETVSLRELSWRPILLSAAVFAGCHGVEWPAALVAGIAYGWLAWKTESLGEAISAHATTNACIACWALATGAWHLV